MEKHQREMRIDEWKRVSMDKEKWTKMSHQAVGLLG